MKKVATLQSKEAAWGKTGKSGCDPNFMWECHDGRMIHPRDMSTHHIWNALKIAWSRRYIKNSPLGKRYWKEAIANLYLELCNRPSLTNEMIETLRNIAIKTVKKKVIKGNLIVALK